MVSLWSIGRSRDRPRTGSYAAHLLRPQVLRYSAWRAHLSIVCGCGSESTVMHIGLCGFGISLAPNSSVKLLGLPPQPEPRYQSCCLGRCATTYTMPAIALATSSC